MSWRCAPLKKKILYIFLISRWHHTVRKRKHAPVQPPDWGCPAQIQTAGIDVTQNHHRRALLCSYPTCCFCKADWASFWKVAVPTIFSASSFVKAGQHWALCFHNYSNWLKLSLDATQSAQIAALVCVIHADFLIRCSGDWFFSSHCLFVHVYFILWNWLNKPGLLVMMKLSMVLNVFF